MTLRSTSKLLIAALAWAIAAVAAPAADKNTPAPDPAYQQSYEKWKADLVDDLKQNWLTLAGLFWLKPGDNTFGTDPKRDIVLPAGSTAPMAGRFDFDKDVTIHFIPGVRGSIDGKIVIDAQLQPDTSGNPTVIELGSLRMHVIKRGDRTGIRVKDLNSAAARNYRGPVFYPINLEYRVTAKWVPSDGKQMIDVPTVLGDVRSTPVAGTAVFELDGKELQLTDLGGNPTKGLFFVFNDLTTKTDTYPGGRFLDTDPVTNGSVVLDFNRAYNPPCAVTPYATCPLAPKQNRLDVAIPAGEKYDRKKAHH